MSGESDLDTLYHYCSTDALFSIVSRGEIWLSSVLQSNDGMEGKFVTSAILGLAQHDKLHSVLLQILEQQLRRAEKFSDCLAFCLSENGDLLSQWRGYANDGAGVSIGFSKDFLKQQQSRKRKNAPGIYLRKVRYHVSQHRSSVQRIYGMFLKGIGGPQTVYRGPLSPGWDPNSPQANEFLRQSALEKMHVAILALRSQETQFLLKSDAFGEEQEWRLHSTFHEADRLNTTMAVCDYRSAREQIVPYRALPLPEARTDVLSHVILGPKNVTPVSVVRGFLLRHGFGSVVVEQSKASYR